MREPPTSKLLPDARQRLLTDLNYLNMSEIRSFCRHRGIPCMIAVRTEAGARKSTNEGDRKGIVLHRIRHFLQTGEILKQTCFPASVQSYDPIPKTIKPTDKLFYGQYDKFNPTMMGLLKDLTGGQFRNGAIARILAREFWTKGKAPTFKQFASAWLRANKGHSSPIEREELLDQIGRSFVNRRRRGLCERSTRSHLPMFPGESDN
jgi:hypothetical protein